LLAGGDDAVAAARRRAVRVASVAAREIAVVAELRAVENVVTAGASLVAQDLERRRGVHAAEPRGDQLVIGLERERVGAADGLGVALIGRERRIAPRASGA
jgi:hypothetical protein